MTNKQMVLKSLRANIETTYVNNGVKWGHVYLEFARPDDMCRELFRGILTALANDGMYQSLDGTYGNVKMEK